MTIPSEHGEQVVVIEWALTRQAAYPELWLLYAIPNGGQRAKGVAGKLKAEGVKAGVPDLCLPVPRGKYAALYIEMKNQKGRVADKQAAWHDALRAHGNCVEICYGAAEAVRALEVYLGVPMGEWTEFYE